MHVHDDLFHSRKSFLGLVDDKIGSFGDDVQFVVGDQCGDFDDYVTLWVETSHLEIHPHQHAMQSRRILVTCLKT